MNNALLFSVVLLSPEMMKF